MTYKQQNLKSEFNFVSNVSFLFNSGYMMTAKIY